MRTVLGLPAFRCGVWVPLLLIPAMLLAAEPRKARTKTPQPEVKAESVELFPAIEKGQIKVRLTAKNADQCLLMVRNATDRPLQVQLPEAFGGVPVLAQRSGGSQAAGDPPVGNPGSTQALGMAPPETLYQPGGSTAHLDVPAGGLSRVMLRSVCLERYKRGPSARIPYQVKPLSQITDKPEVFELCRMISSSNVNMRMVQAAAWHVNNGLDWGRMLQRGMMGPFADPARFSPFELLGAQRLVLIAQQAAEERAKSTVSSASRSQAY